MSNTLTNRSASGFSIMVTLVLLLAVFLSGCNSEKRMQEEEQELINSYLKLKNITQEPTASGLYYIEVLEGTGPAPVAGDTVGVYYKTKFLSGQIFDQRIEGEPFAFIMGTNYVIAGFEEGTSLMKEGGKADLVMPSSLAYGPQGDGWYVGAYTPLLFEMELVYVRQGPGR